MSFLFGGGSSGVTPPKTATMPSANGTLARAAAARQRRDIFGRAGRSSTMLTRRDGEAGTSAYRNSLLGQAS